MLREYYTTKPFARVNVEVVTGNLQLGKWHAEFAREWWGKGKWGGWNGSSGFLGSGDVKTWKWNGGKREHGPLLHQLCEMQGNVVWIVWKREMLGKEKNLLCFYAGRKIQGIMVGSSEIGVGS